MDKPELILSWKNKKWKKRYNREDFGGRFRKYIGKIHLDFGCGLGTFAYLVAKNNPDKTVCGFDINKDKIKIGKKHYKLKNLYLKATDKITGKSDSISLFFVVHHLKDIEKYLREFYKHLNPGGKIMIYDFRKVSKPKFIKWYKKKKEIGEYTGSFEKSYREHNKYTPEEFISIAEKIGFETTNCEKAGNYWFVYIGKK